MLLTMKLLYQELKSSLRQLYGCHNGLGYRYGIYVSQMTRAMFNLSRTLSVLSSFMICHWVCDQINMTSATSEVGAAHPSLVRYRFSVGFMYLDRQFYVCCFVDSCLSFFSCPLCTLSFDLRILITFWYLTTLRMPVRPHNPWWHHEGNHIVVYAHYYCSTYNATYSVVRCGRFSSTFSLTSDILLLFMVLKYIASHYIAVL